jgi:hypothetical protein
MKVSTEIDNNFGYEKITQLVDNIPLKYYLYKCRCLGDKPSIHGGIKYLKYCIKVEKTTINFLSPTQKEYICKKWLPFETVFGV